MSSFKVPCPEATWRAASRGDRSAFEALYQMYAPAVYSLALRMLGDADSAADLTHDVYVKLHAQLRSYKGEAPLGAWLKRITTNAAIDAMRTRRYRMDERDPEYDEQHHALAVSSQAAVRVDVDQLLAQLAPTARAVVVMHQIEGYEHKEIAEFFGMSESFSKSVLSRALSRLRRLLEGSPGVIAARSAQP